jgi:nucleoside-diphosphate-sugar epimerase
VTVVVTGASGLLGRHLVDALLASGRDVRAVDLVRPPVPSSEIVVADLTSLGDSVQALHGASAVVHTAAIPRPVGRTGVDLFRTNVLAAYNVVEAALLHGAKRLVNASSFSVLGFPFNPRPLRPAYLPIDEDHPLAPQEAYGLSKQVTEEIVAAATRRSDLSAVSLRMPWIQTPETFGTDVAGRRLDPNVAAANLWAYLDARDAAQAFLRALDAPLAGHVPVYLTAPDTFMDEDTPTLVRANFGEIELRRPLAGHAPLLDAAAAERLLGFRSEYSWRSYPPGIE